METLEPGRVKPSRIKRMKELQTLEKEARQLHEEFEDLKRSRRRVARKARKLANRVRRKYPDMRLATNDDWGLHEVVEDIAVSIHLDNRENEWNYDDPAHRTERALDGLFQFIRRLSDVPWLKGPGE